MSLAVSRFSVCQFIGLVAWQFIPHYGIVLDLSATHVVGDKLRRYNNK
ncbi:MAG: hypothetical protein WC659_06290 [Patescibacteria group bacterium]